MQIDDGLSEVAFGVMEGKPMSEWFQPWVDGLLTPEGAESFPDADQAGGRRHQPLHRASAGGAGGGARRAVPGAARRDGARTECADPERGAGLV